MDDKKKILQKQTKLEQEYVREKRLFEQKMEQLDDYRHQGMNALEEHAERNQFYFRQAELDQEYLNESMAILRYQEEELMDTFREYQKRAEEAFEDVTLTYQQEARKLEEAYDGSNRK